MMMAQPSKTGPTSSTDLLSGILGRLDDLQPADGRKPESGEVEAEALTLATSAARLSSIELLQVAHKLRDLGARSSFLGDWKSAVRDERKRRQEATEHRKSPTWPYAVHQGRIVYLREKPGSSGTITERVPVADLEARIAEEITTEGGTTSYRIVGRGIRGGDFETEIEAEEFSDRRKLKAALESAAGARDPVRAGMARHLGPAIKLLTGDSLIRRKRYRRTGWAGGRFLLPGRDVKGLEIDLPRKLPYAVGSSSDLSLGLEALEALLLAMTPQRGAVIQAFAFQGPMAKAAGWRNERYALFISGRTGALKSSYAQATLALYGADFMQDELLIKWGEGATRNAIMALAAQAHDLPLLLDNFKPCTGGGTASFVNLIHNILEGGEKDRLNRAAQLRETKPVFCWPLVTGEDVPDQDPATLARILTVPFAWQRGEKNEGLTKAQRLARHLPAVGESWLKWLESDEGKAAAMEAGKQFPNLRRWWADYLRTRHPDMVNVLRVSSNLATNRLAWRTLEQHPEIGPLALEHRDSHQQGLEKIANEMGQYTAEALEGRRFLAALRELLAGGKVVLCPDTSQPPPSVDSERFVGWEDGDGGAYLLSDVVKRKVERIIGPDALGQMSKRALYSQLEALGAIASRGKERRTKVITVNGKSRRVLHIAASALEEQVPVRDMD